VRRVAWLAALATAGYCGVYVLVYLARWQWNRAMFMSLGFIGAEIVVATLVVLRRLDQLQLRHRAPAAEIDPEVLARVREAAPHRQHFAWLDPRRGQLNVFITMLVASGVVVSGVAWLIERIAASTSTQGLERRLGRRLGELAPPKELVVDSGELLAADQPYHPDAELRLLLRPLADTRDEPEPWPD